ncbi:unnamed protein product [Paramecium sonneborni]|uniref:Uncharacterized protein n=1 Tax=Paramecium sonneborni TaxID=65129 RepID=A0A8S1RPP0_9CILI|nr:unnamed protein product [Paramecium sonneborni]
MRIITFLSLQSNLYHKRVLIQLLQDQLNQNLHHIQLLLEQNIEPNSLRIKTELDQSVVNQLKKSVVLISRKSSGVFLYQRIKTQPSIQIQESEVKEIKFNKYNKLNLILMFFVKNQYQHLNHQNSNYKIKVNVKSKYRSSKILRKIIQLFKTHTERSEEKELKSKTIIDTQMSKFNIFLQTQTQHLPQQSLLFQYQQSVITKKNTKFNSQITLTHQDESLKPMKSLIEGIKEKSQDIGNQSSICATTPQFPKNNKKKIKVFIE